MKESTWIPVQLDERQMERLQKFATEMGAALSIALQVLVNEILSGVE